MNKIIKHRKGDRAGQNPAKPRLITALLVLTLLIVMVPMPLSAVAATAEIEKMNIRVEPEYDDPRVLVVLEPVLSEDTKLPIKVKFFISKKMPDATIGMACEVPEGQGHRCKVYDTKDVGDFNELTYAVDSARNLFLEYYADPFKDSKDGKKSFTYEYKAAYAVKQLDIQIQQPLKAEDYKIEPESKSTTQDQQGFTYHTYSFSDVEPGQVLAFNVDYTKTDPEPSIAKQVSNNPVPESGSEVSGNTTTMRLGLFLFVLLLVAGGLAFYWRTQMVSTASATKSQPKRPRPKGPKTKAGVKKTKTSKAKFCGNCGSEVEPGNKFCSECGNEIA